MSDAIEKNIENTIVESIVSQSARDFQNGRKIETVSRLNLYLNLFPRNTALKRNLLIFLGKILEDSAIHMSADERKKLENILEIVSPTKENTSEIPHITEEISKEIRIEQKISEEIAKKLAVAKRHLWYAIGAAALASCALAIVIVSNYYRGSGLFQRPGGSEILKVAFVYPNAVGEFGWSYQHDAGRKDIEKALSKKVKTKFVENVREGPNAESTIRQLAAEGHGLIFTTSFGYMNPTLKVAKEFPNVKFEHASGFKRASNLSTYSARAYEGRAIMGHIAGHVSKSGKIGYIASFPIPEVVRGINAFTIALRRVNPDATVKVVWINAWHDPGEEALAANALIDQGVDILVQHTDTPAPLQVAEKRGVKGFGQFTDMTRFASKAQLTAIIDNWNPYYIARTKAVLDGTWTSTDTWGGLTLGMVKMAPYTNMPKDVKVRAVAMEKKLASGEIHAFDGPIRRQNGELIIGAGERLDDRGLLTMTYYVEGVEGNVPEAVKQHIAGYSRYIKSLH